MPPSAMLDQPRYRVSVVQPTPGRRSADFTQLRDPAVTMVTWPRRLPSHIAVALDGLAQADVGPVRSEAPLAGLGGELAAQIAGAWRASDMLKSWLVRDIELLAAGISRVAHANRIRVRLDRTTSRMCPLFHADAVAYRLLCTYRGRGTEWCMPGTVDRLTCQGRAPCEDDILDIPRGAIAAFRGLNHSHRMSKPLWHRSPAVDQGDLRIVLCIDPLADGDATDEPGSQVKRLPA